MPRAFVYVTVEPGSDIEVLKRLHEIPEIKDAYPVYGVFDIVTRVEADSMDRLNEIITLKIRGLDKVKSTLTDIVSERA